MAKILPPRSGSGRQIEMWTQQVSREITQINMSLARVYLASNQTAIVHDTWTKVLFDTESYDIGSNFASYKYTFPVTGKYLINWGITFTQASKMTLGISSIYIDGAENRRGSYSVVPACTVLRSVGSDLFNVTAGQYAELWGLGYHADGGANTFVFTGGVAYGAYMSVHLISP